MGGGQSFTFTVFSGSGETPSADNYVSQKPHFMLEELAFSEMQLQSSLSQTIKNLL